MLVNQSRSDKLSQLVKSQPFGYSLNREFYRNEEIYQVEIEKLFSKHWLYAGHDSQIPKSGDYFTFEFDTESIIVVRTTSGEIKAHMNVCRHRGSRICTDPSGSTKMLTCPYHAWGYNLDGELISARNMPNGFQNSKYGLHKVSITLIGGLIFICLCEKPPSLSALHRDLDPIFGLFGFSSMKLAQQKSYRIPANWKLAVENYQECYHCAPSHQAFTKVHAMSKAPEHFLAEKETYWLANKGNPKFKAFNHYFDLSENDQEGYQYDRNPLANGAQSGSANGNPVAPLLGSLKNYDGGASELMIGPLSFFLIYDDHMLAYRFLPTSIDDCICDVSWFANKSAVEGKDYQLEQLTWLWDVTTLADKTIIMNNSRYYQPGRLSEMEAFQQSFLNWYLKSILKNKLTKYS